MLLLFFLFQNFQLPAILLPILQVYVCLCECQMFSVLYVTLSPFLRNKFKVKLVCFQFFPILYHLSNLPLQMFIYCSHKEGDIWTLKFVALTKTMGPIWNQVLIRQIYLKTMHTQKLHISPEVASASSLAETKHLEIYQWKHSKSAFETSRLSTTKARRIHGCKMVMEAHAQVLGLIRHIFGLTISEKHKSLYLISLVFTDTIKAKHYC